MTISRIWVLSLAIGAMACGGPIEQNEHQSTDMTTSVSPFYLGQTPPADEPVVFAPGSVSVEGRYEYAMSVHPDGQRLIFTVEIPDKGAAIYAASIEDGVLSEPRPVQLTGGDWTNEMEAFFSPDGEKLFFAPFCKGMDVRIWSAEVTKDGFHNPQPLGMPISEDPSFYPVQATDGTLYYTNLKHQAVYRARLGDGEIETAEPAGLDGVGHAFPSPDGNYILLDSASLNSKEQRDIFVAFKNDDGSWTSPRPLGPSVNTDHSETCPSLSPDGRFIFFSRYNEPGELSNIYWVSSEVIEQFRPEN